MMKNIAILGATGAVGREMLELLRNFPLKSIKCLASGRSAGKRLSYFGGEVLVETVTKGCFDGVDIVLGAASAELTRSLVDDILAAGAVLIDNSSAFRGRDCVPLVVPEINGELAKSHRGIIASPNCSTTIALMAIWPIVREFGLKSMTAATYQAVSGAGMGGIRQLGAEIAKRRPAHPVFERPIAFNAIPKIGSILPDGFTSEEAKMQSEGRKILGLPELTVCCTCVRVPVERCHCVALSIQTERKCTVEQAKAALSQAEGLVFRDTPDFPAPLECEGLREVFVGRLREDPTRENGLALFCCGDQLLKGAAANAVQIAGIIA